MKQFMQKAGSSKTVTGRLRVRLIGSGGARTRRVVEGRVEIIVLRDSGCSPANIALIWVSKTFGREDSTSLRRSKKSPDSLPAAISELTRSNRLDIQIFCALF
jgi:hypothetical protein